MPIWKVAPIELEPEIKLTDWTVFEVMSRLWPGVKTRHFVGYSMYGNEGRVSSAIVRFDAEKMVGVTISGRVYQLEGHQGSGDQDGLHTFGLWCRRNEVTAAEIITISAM